MTDDFHIEQYQIEVYPNTMQIKRIPLKCLSLLFFAFFTAGCARMVHSPTSIGDAPIIFAKESFTSDHTIEIGTVKISQQPDAIEIKHGTRTDVFRRPDSDGKHVLILRSAWLDNLSAPELYGIPWERTLVAYDFPRFSILKSKPTFIGIMHGSTDATGRDNNYNLLYLDTSSTLRLEFQADGLKSPSWQTWNTLESRLMHEGDQTPLYAAISALKSALENNDAAAFANMVKYPIRAGVNGGYYVIETPEHFAANYENIINPEFKQQILVSITNVWKRHDSFTGDLWGPGDLWLDWRGRIVAIHNNAEGYPEFLNAQGRKTIEPEDINNYRKFINRLTRDPSSKFEVNDSVVMYVLFKADINNDNDNEFILTGIMDGSAGYTRILGVWKDVDT